MGPQSHPKGKKKVLSGHISGQQSSMPAPLSPPSLRVYLTPLFPEPYLASILASLHVAGTQHVLLDSVGLFRHSIDVVQTTAGLTADQWDLKLLQWPGRL